MIVSVLLGIQACTYTGEFSEINHDDTFKISYPDYMKECNDLTDNADLQYKNAYRNLYSIIRVSDKGTQTFEAFQQNSINQIKNYELLQNPLVTDSFYREGANFKAIDIQMFGLMDNENIYYWHSSFESEGKYYEVVCWTRSTDRKQRYGADIEKMIASFIPIL